MMFCLLMSLLTKLSSLAALFFNIKQNSLMEFPSMTVNVSLWVVDGNFFGTQGTLIWIINSMNINVSIKVVPGDEAIITQNTFISIINSIFMCFFR